jgi:hypothetical protein
LNPEQEAIGEETSEVFTAGCPYCDETVQLVKSIAGGNWDVQVLEVRSDKAAQARAREYAGKRVPSVVDNGRLADCCRSGAADATALRSLGVGSPA